MRTKLIEFGSLYFWQSKAKKLTSFFVLPFLQLISGHIFAEERNNENQLVDPVLLARSQFFLYLKLFLLMGISWMSEYIHAELHGDHTNMESCNLYVEVTFPCF